MNLAELERDGGVSPVVSPMLSLTEMGNTFARCQYTMPTCDVSHSVFEFASAFELMEFLQMTGEQTCMYESRNRKSLDVFAACAALYQTLFNMNTSAPNLSTSLHVDVLKDSWR